MTNGTRKPALIKALESIGTLYSKGEHPTAGKLMLKAAEFIRNPPGRIRNKRGLSTIYQGRPKGRARTDLYSTYCTVGLYETQMGQIDAYARKHNVSFSQAIRELIEAGVANADNLSAASSDTCTS